VTPDEADLEGRLRVDNPFVWLGSRFVADPARRADLALLYGFEEELRRIAETVENPLIAGIRFAWWREHLDRGAAALPTGHPVADPLAKAIGLGVFDPALLDRMIDDAAGEPPRSGYAPPTLLSAARVLDPATAAEPIQRIGLALSLAIRLRSRRVEEAVERSEGLPPSAARLEALAAFAEAWPEARAASRELSAVALPAVLHATLAPRWAAGRADQPIRDRLRLAAAMARGGL
jgi:15-cis-phytoene synthase